MTLSVKISNQVSGFRLDVDFEAPEGVTALFGPSGSGKSTVVNVVSGLLTPDEGRIAVDSRVLLDTKTGINLPPHHRRIGYVFQEGRLFPHYSVKGNLLFGQKFAGRRSTSADFDHVLQLLDIGPLLDRRPGGLSGGEKQRVAIGRALLSGPDILLMDEPLASLDDARKAGILPYLERLNSEMKLPILYVSHSREEVRRLATTVIGLEKGRVMGQGRPDEVLGQPPGGFQRLHWKGEEVKFDPATALLAPAGSLTSADMALPARVVSLEEGAGGVLVRLGVEKSQIELSLNSSKIKALRLEPGSECLLILPTLGSPHRRSREEGRQG